MKLPNPRISVFVKILFPLLVAMVLISVLIATTVMPLFRPPRPPGPPGPPGPPHTKALRHHFPPPILGDLDRVEKALAKNPTLDSARSVLDSRIDILFESNGNSFTSSPETLNWEKLKARSEKWDGDESTIVGMHRGRPFFGRETPVGKIILFVQWGPPNIIRSGPFWIVLGLQVAGVLLLTYAVLAWQLRPLKTLSLAITELTRGNLAHRIHLKDRGEFGVLSDGFNEMANRLSQMLRAKEELLLGVSHELRSPLASVRILNEMIGDEKKKEQIKKHLIRMEDLLSELLDSQRLSSDHGQPKLEGTSVAKLLEGIKARSVDENRDPGIELRLGDKSLDVLADPRLLDRLFSNLIENAVKYSKGQPVPVRVSARENDSDLIIEITDRGPGIPASDIPQIFEPFYRVDKSRSRETGGFGLGLHLARKIVDVHAGKLEVENVSPHGCCFRVTLPKNLRKPLA